MTSETGSVEQGKAPVLKLDLNVEETKAEVVVVEPTMDEKLQIRATDYAAQLVAIDPAGQDARVTSLDTVEGMGRDLQRRAASRSRMLQAPLRDLSRETEEGGPVAKSLADLRI